MMMRKPIGRLSLVLLCGLAGCAGTPRIVDLPSDNIYHDQELSGEWPVVVLGNPFAGVPQPVLVQAVVEAMPRGLPQRVDFVPAPVGAPPPAQRVVWIYGGLEGGDGSAICRGAGGSNEPDNDIRVYGSVCRGPSSLAAVQGEVGGVTGPTDPKFRRLIQDATVELFSAQPEQVRPFVR